MQINQVELSKLNPDKAYIQITFAEPYFDNYGKCGIGWSRSKELKLAIQNGKFKLLSLNISQKRWVTNQKQRIYLWRTR